MNRFGVDPLTVALPRSGREDTKKPWPVAESVTVRAMQQSTNGKVYLTGAGPGAVDLITVRATQVLAIADVVIYDHLVNEELLNLAPGAAELIYAGKRGGGERALDQAQINQLMVERARAGRWTWCGLRAAILLFSGAAARKRRR